MSTVQIRDLPAASSLDGSELVELQKAAGGAGSSEQAPIGAITPPGYIDGLKMVWVSGTALTVTSGAAYIPSLGRVVRASADIAKTGLSLAANTWYHVYLWLNGSTPDIEIVTTAPDAPYNGTARTKTGDTSRRYVGSVRTNASGGILNFQVVGGKMLYQEPEINLRVLSAGVATTETPVSLATRAPVTAPAAALRVDNNSPDQFVHFGNSIDSASGPPTGSITSSRPGQIGFFDFPLNSAQELTYWYSASTTGGLYLSVMGYIYDR